MGHHHRRGGEDICTSYQMVVEEKDSSRALNLTLTCIWWSDEEVIY